MPDHLPTLRSRYVRVLVWCKACRHQADADLQGWWTLVVETPTSCRVIWRRLHRDRFGSYFPTLGRSGLTQAATKVAMASMTITLLYAVLAIVLAANAVVAIAAISKIEEPGSTRTSAQAHRE